MTDRDDMHEDQTAGDGAPAFDDDRLLAYALGLEDDPGLEAAVQADPALRARLAAMQADVDAVGAGLDRVVPAPADDFSDLSDPRWDGLREFVAAPAPAAPRRRPTWLRVLAPAAAIVLVLVAGVIGVQRLGDVGGEMANQSAADKATAGYGEEAAPTLDGSAGGAAAEGGDDAAPLLERAVPGAAAYPLVVVARAIVPGDFGQRFEVVRVLRDVSAAGIEVGDRVRLRIVDRAVAPDRLVALFLGPAPTPAPATGPSASATTDSQERGVEAAIVEYEYRGLPALALQLPAGTDPDAVTLP
jgi:hypothetical protein